MLLKRIVFSSIVTFLVEDRHAIINVCIILGTQFVDLVIICCLWPWSARSVDWVNIFSGFCTLASYSYIALPIFQADEDSLPWAINDLGAVLLCW